MRRVKALIYLYVVFFPVCLTAQDVTNFTQFFVNPYSFNPSYAGIEGRSAIFLAYRKQWANIEGGPTIANLSLHTPLGGGLNFGMNVSNDTRGVLNASGMMLTLGYTVTIDYDKFIRFGLSGGGAWTGIKLDEITDVNDPALSNLLDNNFSLLGNAGISFHMKSFHLGASLPNIFSPSFVSPDAFTISEVKPFQYLLLHASNRFYFGGDKHIFEPYVIYRMHQGPRDGETLPSQYEVAGILHLNHTVWLGGSYKQDFGISAMGGIKNEFFFLGASYSLNNTGENELNSPTYEVQVSYIFGPKKKNKPVYSFVNSVKPKPPVKTPAQIAAEKRKAEEEKKKAEEAAAAALAAQQAEQEAKEKEEREAQEKAAQEAQEKALAEAQQQTKSDKPPLIIPNVKSEFGVHDGGPRFTNRSLLPVVIDESNETERISEVSKPVENPVALAGNDPNTNPNAMRHEIVQRGDHANELIIGHYIINGVFSSEKNAELYAQGLVKLGFTANYGHLTKKNLWYVYVAYSGDINEAKASREKYRNLRLFKDAWLLTVEN